MNMKKQRQRTRVRRPRANINPRRMGNHSGVSTALVDVPFSIARRCAGRNGQVKPISAATLTARLAVFARQTKRQTNARLAAIMAWLRNKHSKRA